MTDTLDPSKRIHPKKSLQSPPENSAATQKKVELALWAPYNEDVYILGEWNQFQPQPMTRGDDGWWRINIEPGDGDFKYRFRLKSKSYFQVDKIIDVSDPYALTVDHDGDENAALRVRDGQRVYTLYDWKHDQVPLPTNDRLVIYELHIGDFTGTREKPGTFQGAISKLDYLKDMGINAIELMPVKHMEQRGWGYSLKSLFGVDSMYGSPDDLCAFVDECHARAMRVIIDGVYNHAAAEAFLAQIDYEYWFHRNNPDGPDMDWGPKYNYEHFDANLNVFPARKYVVDSIRFWIDKFHVDGIRFDATAALKNFDVMKELTDAAYAQVDGRKPFICIAENIPENPAITGRDRGAPMDAAWHDWYGRVLQAIASGTEQSGNDPHDVERLRDRLNPATNGYELATRSVNYLGTHDYKRPMEIIGEDGNIFGEAAFRRMKLAHGLMLTSPGIPMIWMGSEFGMPGTKTLDPLPMNWELLQNENNRDLLDYHSRLIHLRHDVAALRGDHFEAVICDTEKKVLVYKRWNQEGSVAIVAANLLDTPVESLDIPLKDFADRKWREVTRGQEVRIEGDQIKTGLEGSEVKVFVLA